MKNKIELVLLSIDGKKFHDFVDELYVDIPNSGIMGILPSRIALLSFLFIGTFYTIKNGKKEFFAISGGVLNFKDSVATITCDTFERTEDLDFERINRSKVEAEKILSNIDAEGTVEYEDADFSLKKAMNRLKLLK